MKASLELKKKSLFYTIKFHWQAILLIISAILLFFVVVAQILYPSDYLLPFTKIDGQDFSTIKKTDAIKSLNTKYKNQTIPIFFGQSNKAYRSPKPADIGLVVDNADRVNSMNYPWYLRIIPSSILWLHYFTDNDGAAKYNRDDAVLSAYITKELGESCNVSPTNASLKVNGQKFELVKSENGGTCEIKTVHDKLQFAKPQLIGNYKITIPVKEISPAISDKAAVEYGDDLKFEISGGVKINVNGTSQLIPFSDVISWIDFSTDDDTLNYSFNADRAAAYLNKEIAPKVAVAAGTSYVTTYNFIETARVNGASGRALNISATLNNLKSFIDGDSSSAVATTITVAPKVVYTRNYSSTDTGLSALMQQYAEDHPGVFGISMVELSGQNRRASFNDTKVFTTASTFKLFVAYSTLKRIESGSWNWTDANIAGGRNLSTCFDDMIVKSDNACAEALLTKIGFATITSEAHDIGCTSTTFLNKDGIKTTSADLALFLAQLRMGQILSQQTSRDRLLDAMTRNIYRKGIPAGLPGIIVADKVGFMDGLLHDASIVYSPTGNYVLVIMTDGSSWSTIADLAAQIQALRAQ